MITRRNNDRWDRNISSYHKHLLFCLVSAFLLFFISACSIPSYIYGTGEIKTPISSENAILILGFELSGDELSSIMASIDISGMTDKARGRLIRGKTPADTKGKSVYPPWGSVYTGDRNEMGSNLNY